MPFWLRSLGCTVLIGLAVIEPVAAQTATPHPILFVTQFPIPSDFAVAASVFANHRPNVNSVGRGGDLHIRYPNGSLRNLTAEAGYGIASGLQGANAIAVRDPAVHWSGTKAVFSMVVGGPSRQYVEPEVYWQLYEVTGLGQGETVSITRVANQPSDYNNIMPTYASDASIIFATDRTRGGERHLYPQHDEYESTPTVTGLWKLDPLSGELILLNHVPSGSFHPIVDSFGRVVFTRWDHLMRDQQNDSTANPYGTFNYTSEAPGSTPTSDRSEVFPEPRTAAAGSTLEGFNINHFFPWQINQDGSGEETLNHVGRHELHNYFNRSFNNDGNLSEFIASTSGRLNRNAVLNVLQLREDPTEAGRYLAIDAPEFGSHASGQIIRLRAPPSLNPNLITIEYLTHRDTANNTPSPNHSGHYRNALPLSDGRIVAAHTDWQGASANTGTRAAPATNYAFRLKVYAAPTGGLLGAGTALTPGIVKSVQYYDPDVLVSYNGPFWELSPVEVRSRSTPPATATSFAAPELAAFSAEGVDPTRFVADLKRQGLAVVVMRNVTTRDRADKQQPYNLRVPGGVSTIGSGGKVYDIAHMQFFQGDQIRGIGGSSSPAAGRRVIGQVLHDAKAVSLNRVGTGGPPGSVAIASDGSVAAYVPTRRALAWQSVAPDGTAIVRERYWITLQPGEVRACDGCHGVNQASQSNAPAANNTALAFRQLLATWRDTAPLFADDFEQ
jgi:hypothetical protein